MHKDIFVIGDVHGKYEELVELISKIDQTTTKIYLVGDLVDRGEDSKKVIQFLKENPQIESVMGNHEVLFTGTKSIIQSLLEVRDSNLSFEEKMFEKDMLLLALQSTVWWRTGGSCVYREYNEDYKALLDDIAFLETLPLYIKTGIFNEEGQECLITHTCIIPSLKNKDVSGLIEENPELPLWNKFKHDNIRTNESGYFNIFGHTPTENFCEGIELPEALPYINREVGYANVDTGACYDRKKRGKLTGLFFPSLDTISVDSSFKTWHFGH